MNALRVPVNGTFYFIGKELMLRYYKKIVYLKCIYYIVNVLYYLSYFIFFLWISKGVSSIAV